MIITVKLYQIQIQKENWVGILIISVIETRVVMHITTFV